MSKQDAAAAAVVEDGNPDAGGDAGGDEVVEVAEGSAEESAEGGEPEGEAEEEPGDDGHEDGKVKFSGEQQRAVNGLLAKEKRSRKEVEGRLDETKRELEEYRKRYGEADPETVLRAAQSAGVMPELVTASEAEGVTKLENAKSNQKFFERLLRRAGDEFEVAGRKMTRDEVEASADQWEVEVGKLETRYGGVKARAASAAQDIWKLGLAAKKAGWDPKKRAAAAAGGTEARTPAAGARKPGATAPGGRPAVRQAPGAGGKVDWAKVSAGEMSLEDAIAESERKK